jgi:hypothetical protein
MNSGTRRPTALPVIRVSAMRPERGEYATPVASTDQGSGLQRLRFEGPCSIPGGAVAERDGASLDQTSPRNRRAKAPCRKPGHCWVLSRRQKPRRNRP